MWIRSIKVILLWGFLLFIFDRFLLYLFNILLLLVGFGVYSYYISIIIVILFAGYAGYRGTKSLSSKESINKIITPLLIGTGIVLASLLFTLLLSIATLGFMRTGSGTGLLLIIAGIIGAYIGALRATTPSPTQPTPLPTSPTSTISSI